MWPYSYDTCDLGTFPSQMTSDGTPVASATGGLNGGTLSELPGQKLSACSCPGSDHPGPSTSVGRGVPEIDIFEAQINVTTFQGSVSQSAQIAPYDIGYNYTDTSPITTIYNSQLTHFNSYKGGTLQEAVSAVTTVDSQFYGGDGYAPYGFEYWSNQNNPQDGYITWYSNGQSTWQMTAATIGPNSVSGVNQRLISQEPMVSHFCMYLTKFCSPLPSTLFSTSECRRASRRKTSKTSSSLLACILITSGSTNDEDYRTVLHAIPQVDQRLTTSMRIKFS